MRITLERHGGLAAGVRRRPQVVASSGLTPEAAAEMAKLAAEAKSVAASSGGAARRVPDAMGYTITIEENGQPPVILRRSDGDLPDAVAALLDWIEEHGGPG